MIHFAFHRPPLHNPQVEKLLDTAFSVNHYSSNFPHVFEDHSGALVATATAPNGVIKALCAVDSEIWSEPSFLRGACIGSVAVAPDAQGQGLGRTLLVWVVEQIAAMRLHDFFYLFSQPRSFYTGLGFVAAGSEGLYRVSPRIKSASLPPTLRMVKPREISQLDCATRMRLWCALERGRKAGESHACWAKFNNLCALSGVQVMWLEFEDGRIVAGAYIGKGIDFRGVMHTFFAESDVFAEFFFTSFVDGYADLSKILLIAPGLWLKPLERFLDHEQSQTLCLVRSFEGFKQRHAELFARGKVYPRSLFSS